MWNRKFLDHNIENEYQLACFYPLYRHSNNYYNLAIYNNKTHQLYINFLATGNSLSYKVLTTMDYYKSEAIDIDQLVALTVAKVTIDAHQ